MNRKGFTLTEILVVLVLIAGVSTMSIIGVINLQERTNQKKLDTIIESLEQATDVYINNDSKLISDLLNGKVASNCTHIFTLQSEGLIEEPLINPMTNIEIDNNLCVISVLENGTIKNTIELE